MKWQLTIILYLSFPWTVVAAESVSEADEDRSWSGHFETDEGTITSLKYAQRVSRMARHYASRGTGNRILQSGGVSDAFCAQVLRAYFDGCTCQANGDEEIILDCKDYCTKCLPAIDACVTNSFRLLFQNFEPTFSRIEQRQYGEESSNKTLRIEQFFVLGTSFCSTFIDNEQCDSCTLLPSTSACEDGSIQDCRNVVGINAVINTCEVGSLPFTNPFAPQVNREFILIPCSTSILAPPPTRPPTNPPVQSPVWNFPPKKVVPLDTKVQDKAKLFHSELDSIRGKLHRRIRS